MHLTRMIFSGVPPVTAPVEFRFDERVNVFVGPNASGKSTALLLLADRLIGPDENAKMPISQGREFRRLSEVPEDEFDEFYAEETQEDRLANLVAASPDWFGTKYKYIRPEVAPAVVLLGAIRSGLPGMSGIADDYNSGTTAADILAGLFSGIRLVHAIEHLADEHWLGEPTELNKKARSNLLDAVRLADACSKAICDEVIADAKVHNYIPGQDVRDYLHHPYADTGNIRILRQLAVNTTDIRNFDNLSYRERPSYEAYYEAPEAVPIYLGHLSAGTEGTLLWVRWLALKMLLHYEFAYDWAKQPAILLIDEIENHLHPTWQRRVIPALLKHFPGLQIFATTHSPFVIAGLKAGQVHLLNRDANGVITASSNSEDIIGWTADEILRVFMGVEDPTDDATAAAARELRQLRDAGPYLEERQEEQRQARMQELRCLVNRDLLAGGPRAAEEERFAENLTRILEKYRLTKDLNQENG